MSADDAQREIRTTIEALVRETLARLANEQKKHGAKEPREQQAIASPGQTTAEPADTLTISAGLITVATLHGRLKGMRRVVVRPRTVVTPAAKEWLQDRGVTLAYGTPGADPRAVDELASGARTNGDCPGRRRLTLAVAGAKYDSAPLAAALGREGVTVDMMNNTDRLATIDALAATVRDQNTLAMLLTSETAAAACRANRAAGVRAAVACSPQETGAAIRSFGANLLVIDPGPRTYWELFRMARQFAGAGPQPCPAAWQERLSR